MVSPRRDSFRDDRQFDFAQQVEQSINRILTRGLWTPVLRGSTLAGVYETTEAVGRWWCLADSLVFIEFRLLLDNPITGGGTGDLEIAGLPFKIATDSHPRSPAYFSGYDTAATTGVLWSKSQTDDTALLLREVNDNAAFGTGAIAGVAASDQFGGSIFYERAI